MTMADTQIENTTSDPLRRYAEFRNNNHPLVANHNHHHGRGKQRKRKRLSQVVDKLAGQASSPLNNNFHSINNNLEKLGPLTKNLKLKEEHYSEEDEEVFSSSSSHSSNADSPKISFSPLRLKEGSIEEDERHRECACPQCVPNSYSTISPITPPMAAHIFSFEQYLHSKYLPDIFRRRCHSDSDAPMWFEARTERSSVNSFQDSPLDLSMKSSKSSDTSPSSGDSFIIPTMYSNVPVVKGDVASPTTKESVAVRYNLEVSPVVEEMPPGSDVAYVCPVCGQMFSLHDRLAKHMASRHKSRTTPDASSKAYLCEVCQRSFARSDMLTRHMRLHTGVKPYTCRVCGQVFSRSDHLSTHQRTHTGEKPYKCPQCPYAACRRDMITRHMRTHSRFESGQCDELSPQSLSPHEDIETKERNIVPAVHLLVPDVHSRPSMNHLDS
ncbi:zinc finger and SCAN domain-containing protein 22 [Halyomorpha halys]|uniref:zinc finger and SCAN domain-containing protein 22 n=1 Tax=Halyomorpha halys TaxID=286706 RepID=UPI0006D4E8A0|nr:zinc finger and SCAN domain-containing protein 22 [Halyomorpha halys]XP_014290164.1 zinc finger and SCAN domain-containing protein 22 [Halyomorpha halys]